MAPGLAPGSRAFADGRTRVALKEGAVVLLRDCPAQPGPSFCRSPTGIAAGTGGGIYTAPFLLGDFGRPSGPEISTFTANDPDDGDATFGSGDELTLVFDQRTNRGERHSDFLQPTVEITAGGLTTVHGYAPRYSLIFYYYPTTIILLHYSVCAVPLPNILLLLLDYYIIW